MALAMRTTMHWPRRDSKRSAVSKVIGQRHQGQNECNYFITSNPPAPTNIPPAEIVYACFMNIVFDFGNVLFEWNPAQLITHHYEEPDGKAQFAEALADTLINHQDWLDFDLGLIDSQQLAERSARRLGLNTDELRAFVDRIPHVLPVFEPAIALMSELADGLHGAHRVVYLSNQTGQARIFS